MKSIEYQTSLFRGQPDDEAIKQIRFYEPLALELDPRGYCVCTSEGKDSRVLGHLFRRAGVQHWYLHSVTGIDPPELVYFQRRNFQSYRDEGYLAMESMYGKSMWRLMAEKKFPPLRMIRYCCSELKEKRSPWQSNCLMSFGVRKKESAGRAKNRDELEIAAHGRRGKNIIMPFDDDENRRIFEVCYRDYEKRLNPIVSWSSEDIWNYSRDARLEQCSLYQEGFERLGCVGCTMARETGRKMEFARWPKFEALYLRAFEKMLEIRKAQNMTILDHAATPRQWFDWWLSEKTQETVDEDQLNLWDI